MLLGAYLKGSEPPQFDSISATQGFDHFDEYRVDDLLYIALKKVRNSARKCALRVQILAWTSLGRLKLQ